MTLQPKRPQRRITDHVHVEYWTEQEQHRFEDGLRSELRDIKGEVKTLSNRLILVIGGLGLLAFILPIAAPFIRTALGL